MVPEDFMMTDNIIDSKLLAEFLAMGGPEIRAFLLSQIQTDLCRCRAVIAAQQGNIGDLSALRNAAHEMKGLAATIGAVNLAQSAENVERLCAAGDTAQLEPLLPVLAQQVTQTVQTIVTLTRAA